jgi:hypothetical protein
MGQQSDRRPPEQKESFGHLAVMKKSALICRIVTHLIHPGLSFACAHSLYVFSLLLALSFQIIDLTRARSLCAIVCHE